MILPEHPDIYGVATPQIAERERCIMNTPRESKREGWITGEYVTSKVNSNTFGVNGTDLGIPYRVSGNEVNYLFGDTFSSAAPGGPDEPPGSGANWRSPVALKSYTPVTEDHRFFSKALGTNPYWANELFYNAHQTEGVWVPGRRDEFTVIPNDGIYLPETGRHLINFMSVNRWDNFESANPEASWRTGYSSFAYSDDEVNWHRVPFLGWENERNNLDPFQMVSMEREGDYVYFISVRAGRQMGPMMLRRCHYMHLFDKNAYEGWGWNGYNWGWGRPCTSIFPERMYGEPSLRKIGNKWVMAYVDYSHSLLGGLIPMPSVVTRTADQIDGLWTSPKVQVTALQVPNLYGGFLDPREGENPGDISMFVSQWMKVGNTTLTYHVELWSGSYL